MSKKFKRGSKGFQNRLKYLEIFINCPKSTKRVWEGFKTFQIIWKCLESVQKVQMVQNVLKYLKIVQKVQRGFERVPKSYKVIQNDSKFLAMFKNI